MLLWSIKQCTKYKIPELNTTLAIQYWNIWRVSKIEAVCYFVALRSRSGSLFTIYYGLSLVISDVKLRIQYTTSNLYSETSRAKHYLRNMSRQVHSAINRYENTSLMISSERTLSFDLTVCPEAARGARSGLCRTIAGMSWQRSTRQDGQFPPPSHEIPLDFVHNLGPAKNLSPSS